MRNSTFILLAFVLCGSSVLGQTESDIRDRIVGTWKLVSTEQTMKDGTTRPYPRYGAQGKGFLMYQRDGYMCADLVNPDRPNWADPVHPTPEEKLAAADGMVEILKDNARPEAGAVYAALDMPWATLVGQIAKAYGK